MTNLFDKKSKDWDKKERRVKNAKSISNVIKNNIQLTKEMDLIDFGAGTGLLSYFLSDSVGSITAVDTSKSMLDMFSKKSFFCKTDVLNIDLTKQTVKKSFDGIVSSMTLHHIKDLKKLFSNFYEILKKDGFIALADLKKEDGDFHSDNTGVYHYGFEKEFLEDIAKSCRFCDIDFFDCDDILKENKKRYKVFCLIGYKR